MKILFDCDGTILDSMHIWLEPLYLFFEKYDYKPTKEEKGYIEALDFDAMISWIKENLAKDMSLEEVDKHFRETVENGYKNTLMPKKGAVEILDKLKEKGVRMAIASSTDYHLLSMAFERLGLMSYFEFVQSPDKCGFKKNEDDFWRLACEKLGSREEDTVLYDDALYAVKAANKVGIKTCGLKDFPFNENEWEDIKKEADHYLDTIADIDLSYFD